MPQKRMEWFRLLFDHLAWIEHQFLSGIRDSRKTGSLWEMMRGVGGVRKSIHQSWLTKGLGLGLLCWGFKGVQEEILSEGPALFKSGQWHFQLDNTPVHNSTLVTDYLSKIGIKTVLQPPYYPDLAPCDFWLFPQLRGCRYETRRWKRLWRRSLTRSHKRTSMDLAEVIGTVQQVHCSEKRLLRRGLGFHMCTINKSAHTKKVWKLI